MVWLAHSSSLISSLLILEPQYHNAHRFCLFTLYLRLKLHLFTYQCLRNPYIWDAFSIIKCYRLCQKKKKKKNNWRQNVAQTWRKESLRNSAVHSCTTLNLPPYRPLWLFSFDPEDRKGNWAHLILTSHTVMALYSFTHSFVHSFIHEMSIEYPSASDTEHITSQTLWHHLYGSHEDAVYLLNLGLVLKLSCGYFTGIQGN